eukprot:3000456-Amphidinium_carterae.2
MAMSQGPASSNLLVVGSDFTLGDDGGRHVCWLTAIAGDVCNVFDLWGCFRLFHSISFGSKSGWLFGSASAIYGENGACFASVPIELQHQCLNKNRRQSRRHGNDCKIDLQANSLLFLKPTYWACDRAAVLLSNDSETCFRVLPDASTVVPSGSNDPKHVSGSAVGACAVYCCNKHNQQMVPPSTFSSSRKSHFSR